MSRQEELNAIKEFEETKGIQKFPMVDTLDALLARERAARASRAEKRRNNEPQRLHSWTRSRKPKGE